MDAVLGVSNVDAHFEDVVLAKRGDKIAFERLFRKHSVSLYRVARGILKCDSDIEDAIQDTIIKAYHSKIMMQYMKLRVRQVFLKGHE